MTVVANTRTTDCLNVERLWSESLVVKDTEQLQKANKSTKMVSSYGQSGKVQFKKYKGEEFRWMIDPWCANSWNSFDPKGRMLLHKRVIVCSKCRHIPPRCPHTPMPERNIPTDSVGCGQFRAKLHLSPSGNCTWWKSGHLTHATLQGEAHIE